MTREPAPTTPTPEFDGVMKRSFETSFAQPDYRGLWHLATRRIALPPPEPPTNP